mgnify:CR=1 FL=1
MPFLCPTPLPSDVKSVISSSITSFFVRVSFFIICYLSELFGDFFYVFSELSADFGVLQSNLDVCLHYAELAAHVETAYINNRFHIRGVFLIIPNTSGVTTFLPRMAK